MTKARGAHGEITIGLVGNPNSGKTTIFNALTGARQKVANWSGVTVEKREGRLKFRGYTIRVIDLPGTYSLTSYTIEEIITRDFIINERPDVIVNVVDAGNLERNLYLTTQLIDIGARMVMALNMFDEAVSKGVHIDTERLGTLLGMPVIGTVGTRSEGVPELLDAIVRVSEKTDQHSRHLHIPFGADVENEIIKIQAELRKESRIAEKYSTRWLAVRLLERDDDADLKIRAAMDARHRHRHHGGPGRDPGDAQPAGHGYAGIVAQVDKSRRILENKFNDDIETVISDRRYGFLAGAVLESVKKTALRRVDVSERIDKVITNRYLGFPILFIFLWVLFYLTFSLGEYPKQLIEKLVEFSGSGAESLMPPGPFKNMVVDGIIGGVGSVIVFLPNILILFMGISFMEDTGYMARAAFIMDRIMHRLGLHGKSFIPLIMGFGCNVPAIMTARSLENRQDRLLTILINPFMSCSARLPVYILFAGIFFHEHAGTVILSLYCIGILLAFFSARLFKLVFFKGKSTPFVMELPPYRIPTLRTTLLHMWDRASQYLRKMGGIILAFSIIIWAMGEYPKSPDIEKKFDARIAAMEETYRLKMSAAAGGDRERMEQEHRSAREALAMEKNSEVKTGTMIGRLGRWFYPALEPLGFNWQMGVSLITGFVAKEIVVSTMGVLYHTAPGEDPHYTQRSLEETLVLPHYGITPLIAYTFMLFVLLYVPCLATIVIIGREAGWGWAAFSIFYQLLFAWIVCFLVYRGGTLLGL